MLGRFGGSALMKTAPAPRLLSIFGAGWLVSIVVALSVSGPESVWALVLIGFFTPSCSLQFCAQHQESWPAYLVRLFSPGHGDSRQRSSPRNHGTHLRYHQHLYRVCGSARLSPFTFFILP
jgi:hypothetical protein